MRGGGGKRKWQAIVKQGVKGMTSTKARGGERNERVHLFGDRVFFNLIVAWVWGKGGGVNNNKIPKSGMKHEQTRASTKTHGKQKNIKRERKTKCTKPEQQNQNEKKKKKKACTQACTSSCRAHARVCVPMVLVSNEIAMGRR
jgi:hypothetical protein